MMFSCALILCKTYLDFARALLDLGVADGAVLLDNHGPATVALAQAGPAVVLAEEGLGVGHEELG